MTACMDLLAPFCPHGVAADEGDELPHCAGEGPSAAKAAALLREAQERQAALEGPPWLLIGGGVAVAGVVLWLVFR